MLVQGNALRITLADGSVHTCVKIRGVIISNAIYIGTFEFNHCPECGSTDLKGWVFKCVLVEQIRECKSCGKVWHVIWENEDTWEDVDDE